MNRFACLCLTVALLLAPVNAFAVAPKLKLTENRRYLQYENGKPFFYLGDTAWELFHRLNREEASQYLTNRAQKGFTVIQAVALAQLGGLTVPNAYGDLPLAGGDPAKPNEAYFRHVDFIVNKAEELGLFVGMLPTWGSYWAIKSPGDKAAFNPTNARSYGRFLGARYKDKPIIWVLGGDRSVTNDAERAIIEAMAAGLTEGDGGTHLKTFHPIGPGLSSLKLHDATWLDFNMSQSSHAARDHDNGLYIENDYALKPVKPTLDGEPRYEGIPVGFYNRNATGIDRFDDYDVRQAAYWSLLAGACGYTYGNNNIWQMFKPAASGTVGDPNRLRDLFGLPGSIIGANIPWHEALDHPGAFQMRHVRRLFESLPFTKLVPDQSLILNGPTTGGAKMRAARASDGSFAMFYSPRGESFTLNKNVIKADQQRQYWFDPRYGVAYSIKDQDSWGIQTFTPPTSGRGNDWLLVLTDAAGGFSLPGTAQ
ncbi:MAG: glycoside hydrolase family 140 protein [Acidobacteria bacterium]|nr:glycoside hydrolase family 140 protein [Acidobacteriota bacterium]